MKRLSTLKAKKIVIHLFLYILIFLGMIIFFYPFLWMLTTSLGTLKNAYSLPPRWIPYAFRLNYYTRVLTSTPVFLFMFNSLKITGIITVGQLLFCSMAAFAFARLNFPGKNILFALLLSSMMVPHQVTIVPIFMLMRWLHLLDTHASLILPGFVSAFGVFFLRQFFKTIPQDLEDSARIDGANNYRIYFQIFLPLSGASLSALAVLCFLYFWNELFRPLIFLSSYSKKTLPLLMVMLQGAYGQGNVGLITAGATLGVLPIFIVFIIAQRYIVEGIVLTGIKG